MPSKPKKYLSQYKELCNEFHPTKNGDLKPEDLTHGSSKRLWWKCSKGHEWDAVVSDRTRGGSCPYCSGSKPSKDNNLKVLYPDIAEEWHPNKNGDLRPEYFTQGSGKKVWWKCPKGHEWDAVINSRTLRKSGCPYCSGSKPTKDNNLKVIYPDIAKEFHPTKNGDLKTDDITISSGKKVWWKCPKGHEYKYVVSHRTLGQGCPYCSGKKPSIENNLKINHPDIAEEWHPNKNGDLKPENFINGSVKNIWWQCSKGHEWSAMVKTRTKGHGCPYCTNQSSKPEVRLLTELMYLFDDLISRHKVSGVEIDAFVPTYNIGFEYDGYYYHKGKEKKDIKKAESLKNNNINLIRIRENPLNELSKNDLIVKNTEINKSDLDKLFLIVKSLLDSKLHEKIDKYIKRKSFVNDAIYREYISYFPSPFPEKSLLNEYEDLSKEWDYKKNTPLRPENFTSGSIHKAWWKCLKGHEWNASINNRVRGTGCPVCSGKRPSKDNNLKVNYPDIAKEWHKIKNGDLKPESVVSGSHNKAWWQCPKGHEWNAVIKSRTNGHGCPYCSGRKPSKDNNLKVIYPDIAKEWHPNKNGDLRPEEVTCRSNKKIWWICSKGHERYISVDKRTSGRGCPACYRDIKSKR